MKYLYILLIAFNFLYIVPKTYTLRYEDSRRKLYVDDVCNSIGVLNSEVCTVRPQSAWVLNSKWFPMPHTNIFQTCAENNVEFVLVDPLATSIHPSINNEISSELYSKNYELMIFDTDRKYAFFKLKGSK